MFLYSLIWDNAHKKSGGKLVKKNILNHDDQQEQVPYERQQKGSQKENTMIEANIDVKTTDDYLLHLFCVGFTKNATIRFGRPPMPSTSRSAKFRRR